MSASNPTSQPDPIQRSVLVDDVYEEIKSRIMDQTITPGKRIGIDAIAKELDVSPTPVREALVRLEADHLVSKEPLKGYRSTPIVDADVIVEIFELRNLVEPWAAAQAARRATDQQRQQLAAELDQHGIAPSGDTYADYRGFTEHDQRFHNLLFEFADNRYVGRAFDQTHIHLQLFRLHFGRSYGPATVAEHQDIVDAVAVGDPDAAAAAMQEHLDRSQARMLNLFSTPPKHTHP